jgi:hypothetical protein
LFYYIFANVLYVIPLVGETWVVRLGTTGLFGGEQYGCFPAAQTLAKHLNYFTIT